MSTKKCKVQTQEVVAGASLQACVHSKERVHGKVQSWNDGSIQRRHFTLPSF